MELRVLKYFLAVTKTENITAAAELLNITQPTLSKQLTDLEKELGQKLFHRGKRKTTLTEKGEFLKQHAQQIVELAIKTELAFKASNGSIPGEVYIGCGETPGIRQLFKVIREMNSQFPDIRYHFYCGNVQDVSYNLDTDQVDFGVFSGHTGIIEKYDYMKLPISDTWGLLIRKDNPLADCLGVTPEDIRKQKIICSKQALASNDLSGWLGAEFTQLNIVSRHNLIYTALQMVEEGLGCALTKEGLVNTEGKNIVFRPLISIVKADLIIAWKKYQILSETAKLFLNQLQTLFIS